MQNEELLKNLSSLKEALRVSPENIPLRSMYVDALLKLDKIDEAMNELKSLVKEQPENIKFRYQLADIYYKRWETSKGIVLIEDLVKSGAASKEVVLLYVKLRIEEGSFDLANETYRSLKSSDSSIEDSFIEDKLRSAMRGSVEQQAEDVLNQLPNLDAIVTMERPTVKFNDVGGMDTVKDEIAFKIIKPLQHPELFATYGKKAGGGILLYGPPGCGKTYIARATAGETNSVFLPIGISDVLSMYIGGSEGNLHAIFEYTRRNTPAVLFFDEVDALGASRTDMKHSVGRHLINQFLDEMDGARYSNEGILILGATNAPWNLDSAFTRPGRFDRVIFVPPPDYNARIAILKVMLRDKPVDNIDYEQLAKKTVDFSGADLYGLVDVTLEELLREVLHTGNQVPITTKHLIKSLKLIKPSTKDWFKTARNYAVYANESGLYDDIAKYMGL